MSDYLSLAENQANEVLKQVERIRALNIRHKKILDERDQEEARLNEMVANIGAQPKRGLEAVLENSKSLSWMDQEVAQSAGGKTP